RRAGRGLPGPGRGDPRRLLHPPTGVGGVGGGWVMDPLESIHQYRQQEATGGRVVRIAPPPTIPMPTPTVETPAIEDDTGELDLTDLVVGVAPEGEGRRVPGTLRGRKRLMQVYLPAPTRRLLENGRQIHGTLGAAVM